jgi:hypothetical protein
MKTWKQALALVLALVMALSLVALPSFAEGEETGGGNDGMPYIEENGHGGTVTKDGLVMSKTIKKTGDSQFLLTLEAYATGSTTTTTSTAPVDIVLVLDVSGSMDKNLMNYTYNSVYNPKTNGRTDYYYQDENGQYQRVYYCDGEVSHIFWNETIHPAGWYTENHQSGGDCQGESGTRLTPKTSASDTDTSRTQFYTRTEQDSGTKKIAALKTAVSTFIDSVAEKSPDSSIAIVKFAGNKLDTVGNDTYRDGRYTYNYSQIVQELTPVNTGASSLKIAVNGLIAAGATAADYGMQHAQTIINGAKDDGRQKVVIMFTDGEPNHNTNFDDTVANAAITASKAIKDDKAIVYTIGCFGGQAGSSDVDTYMNYVSSNYPNATSMTSGGAKADPANYYKTVSSAADLNNIFTDISQTIGGTTVTLGSTSVLRDVISDSFKLPEGADKNSITAYSVDCTAVKDDGTYTWSANRDDTKYSVTVEGKTINVTDFDYAANWVGKDTTTGEMHTPAKKLVVEIPIVPEQVATGSVKTNGDASGIYADSTVKDPVEKFPSPVVYIPYFTVTHVASTVDSATGANKGEVRASKNYPLWCYKEFDLTSVVTKDYLYGGTFNEEACTTVHNDVQGSNPMKLNPTENATYYIWEVPNTYLTPRNYNVWRHLPENNGQKTVVRLYPLTTADRIRYKQVGFVIDGQDYVSGCDEFNVTINNTPTLYQTAVAKQNGQHYQTLYLDKGTIRASNTAIDESGLVSGQHIDDGCLAGIKLDANGMSEFKTTGVTFRPYWITLDNVKVYGTTARTCTYVAGSESPSVSDDKTSLSCVYMGDTVTTQAMSFAKSFTMADSQPAVDESLTVTVVDGSNTTQVKVAPNGSVRDQVAYQAPAGKVFAGWFADQAYTTPADLDQVTQDTTIYAKYVSDSYLDLAYSRTGLFRLRGVTLISAVDNPANYQASGIMVNGQKLDVSYASRYRIFKTPANLFGAARDAKLMLADKSLSGTGTLEVTPYWITLDGTEVHGITHSLHYNTRTIWE